jgi:hypothetical protein
MITISLFWFLVAMSIAIFEIELEGKYGWAEKSATWSRKFMPPKVLRLFSGARVLTGYHIFLNIFLLLFMHSPFFFGVEFTVIAELNLLAIYLIWTIFWDFLWFILNPFYGWAKFSPKAVWWFGEEPWLMNKLPVKYFIQIGISLSLVIISIYLGAGTNLLKNHLVLILLFIFYSILSHLLIRPLFHKYYWALHKKI